MNVARRLKKEELLERQIKIEANVSGVLIWKGPGVAENVWLATAALTGR